jgi:hypothetical protein
LCSSSADVLQIPVYFRPYPDPNFQFARILLCNNFAPILYSMQFLLKFTKNVKTCNFLICTQNVLNWYIFISKGPDVNPKKRSVSAVIKSHCRSSCKGGFWTLHPTVYFIFFYFACSDFQVLVTLFLCNVKLTICDFVSFCIKE